MIKIYGQIFFQKLYFYIKTSDARKALKNFLSKML